MIEEQFVSFETAKLLKEAGFDVPCFNQYTERGTIWHCDCPENFNKSQCATSCLDCEDEDVTFGFNYASRQYAMEAGLQEAIKLIKK